MVYSEHYHYRIASSNVVTCRIVGLFSSLQVAQQNSVCFIAGRLRVPNDAVILSAKDKNRDVYGTALSLSITLSMTNPLCDVVHVVV